MVLICFVLNSCNDADKNHQLNFSTFLTINHCLPLFFHPKPSWMFLDFAFPTKL